MSAPIESATIQMMFGRLGGSSASPLVTSGSARQPIPRSAATDSDTPATIMRTASRLRVGITPHNTARAKARTAPAPGAAPDTGPRLAKATGRGQATTGH